MTVTVNSLPVIDMSTVAVSNENCNQSDGSIGGIQVNGGIPNYQYGWNTTPPSTTLSISGLSDGMYQLVVTDANGCFSTTSVQVGSNPAPQIDATGLNVTQPTCVDGGSISGITASGSAPLTYSWTGTSQTGSTLSNLQAGSYALTVTDAAGCTAQYGPIVLVNPVLPQADFTWTPTTPDVNTTVTFTDNSTGNGIVSYQWQIDGQAPSGQQVETAFTAGGTYTIVLTVTDANGCVDDTMQLITVLSEIQVPNVITANGDGVNDLFIIDGLTENTTLTILNRWGNVVFTTENYQNNWNGRDTSGKELTDGVYTYIYKTSYQQTGHGFIHVIH
jgi:gliding motility-associated-like protein